MKRVLLTIAFLLSVLALSARQDKRVYITLDVSGSMTGDKYALANYTAQMLVTLCDDNDEIRLIIAGKENSLSRTGDGLRSLQHPINRIPLIPFGADTDFEINDIIVFNRTYRPSKTKQDWIFIIGDGIWDYDARFDPAVKDFAKIVEKGDLNVCYLQTGSSLVENNGFTQFLETLGVADIGKSSVDPNSIRSGCDRFARKILGFSDVPLAINKTGSRSITLKTELPVLGFYLVYQDEVDPKNLPNLEKVSADGQTLQTEHRGTPTTIPTKDSRVSVDLSGNVWKVSSRDPLPVGTEIEAVFDRDVDPANILVYPIVDNVEFGAIGLLPGGKQLKQVDSHTFTICRDESTAWVRTELTEKTKEALPETVLKDTKVIVKANNKEYEAKYKNGGFECEIDLVEDETQYYAEAEYPGYFKRVTPIMTITKAECSSPSPKDLPVNQLEDLDIGVVPFRDLRDGSITFTILDSKSKEVLDPDLFDIQLKTENDYLYDELIVDVQDDNTITVKARPKGNWCECFFPDSLKLTLVSTPKEDAYKEYGKNYEQSKKTIRMKILKDRPWLLRCWWVIMTIIGLLLLFFYLSAMQRKRRFKKSAMVSPTYYDYRGRKIEQSGFPLRKNGFKAWLARWFWPGSEQNTLYWSKPNVSSLKFIASDSFDAVLLPKEGNIDPTTMTISGYNPKKDTTPKEPIKLGNKGRITVTAPNGKDDGYLTFTSGNEAGGSGYRLLLGILRIASLIAVAVLLFLTVRSFF